MADWQTTISLCVVAFAAIYLIVRLTSGWTAQRRRDQACRKCPASKESYGPKTIELFELTADSGNDTRQNR